MLDLSFKAIRNLKGIFRCLAILSVLGSYTAEASGVGDLAFQMRSGAKTPPILTFRADDATALNMLEAIADLQAPNPPPPNQQDPDEGDAESYSTEIDFDEMEAIAQHPGEQDFTFFRADPGATNRPIRMDLHAPGTMSAAAVRRRILQQWPDLRHINWQVLHVDESIESSPFVSEGVINFLIWTSSDLLSHAGAAILLLEVQYWDLHTGDLEGTLMPISIWNSYSWSQLYTDIGIARHCETTPCPIRQNFMDMKWKETISIWDAAHLVVAIPKGVNQLRTILAAPTQDDPTHADLPLWFRPLVTQRAQQQHLPRPDLVGANAARFQLCLSVMARQIYDKTRMQVIYSGFIAVVKVQGGPTEFTRIHHAARVDPFGLLYEVEDSNLAGREDAWYFIKFHDSIDNSQLPTDAQYVGLLIPSECPMPLHVFTLLELTVYEPNCEDLSTTTYRTMWQNWLFQGQTLYDDESLSLLRFEVCELHVNGVSTGWEANTAILDGCFLQVVCQKKDEAYPALQADNVVENEDEASEIHEPAFKRLRPQSSSTTMHSEVTPPPGQSMVLTMAVRLFIAFCNGLKTDSDKNIPQKKKMKLVSNTFRITGSLRTLLAFALCLPVVSWRARTVEPTVSFGIAQWWLIYTAVASYISTYQAGKRHKMMVWGLVLAGTLAASRIGEAQNPGPYWLGTTNPTGVARKEFLYGMLPEGLWGASETQLTAHGQRSTRKAFEAVGRSQQRLMACCYGAPVAPRARSLESGTWAGVMLVGAASFRPVHIPWPFEEYTLGRVQIVEARIAAFPLVIANVYGWAKSPTWPQAHRLNAQLLDTITSEIVLSRNGPRAIIGDLNLQDSPHFQIWQNHGWIEAQEWARIHLGRPVEPTSQGATRLDFLWLSPELIPYLKDVKTWDYFSEHSALGACLDLPLQEEEQFTWHLPSFVPWAEVDRDMWHTAANNQPPLASQGVDERFQEFCGQFEQSFDGTVSTPNRKLPSACFGRGRTRGSTSRKTTRPFLRPSRPGEVVQAVDVLGRGVQHWFMQLRRLQSMTHALKAAKDTVNAVVYRLELWRSIRLSQGFREGFSQWWHDRPIQLQGSPANIPLAVPSLEAVQRIFDDFQVNYKKLERWHFKQRQDILQVSLQTERAKIFSLVKPEGKSPLVHLEDQEVLQIQEIRDNGTELHLSGPIPPGNITCAIGDIDVPILSTQQNVLVTDGELLIQPGTEVKVTTHYDTPQDLHGALQRYWEARWWKNGPSQADWERIFAFARAYLPQGSCAFSPIEPAAWADINSRYTVKSARGPDGFSAKDLIWMPPSLQTKLVAELNRWEASTEWPDALLSGFVYPLPKKELSSSVGDYRPVIIYSTIYRSWSSLRARTFLRHLATFADDYQYGFLPNCEAAQIWMLLQALIECSHQTSTLRAGFVTDLVKAFETLPRAEVFMICRWLGLPEPVLKLWNRFLTSMTRRFKLGDTVGPPIASNRGFPEGCALSCVAMAAVDLCYHAYMRIHSPTTIPLSFVDNIELVENQLAQLATASVCVQTWADMWGLQLDNGKTYTWATTAEARQQLHAVGWPVRESAKDLGAQLTYGKRKSVKEQQSRLDSLQKYWHLLTRIVAADALKCQVLYQAFWPRAFHGVATCTLGWSHIKSLRASAMRSLRHNRAGANPAIRLGLLTTTMLCDPGFYQFWTVIGTFRRMMIKQPSFSSLWMQFMDRWRGQSSHGPFGKMLELTSQVGWAVDAPFLTDHDGVQWHLPSCDEKALRRVAVDAWAQKISHEVVSRKDYQGLDGLDHQVLQQASRKLLPYQKAWLALLRDGSFVNPSQHKKFDLSKVTACPLCGREDSVAHRIHDCNMLQDVYNLFGDLREEWESMPISLKERLLPNRNPWQLPLRRHLSQRSDHVVYYASPCVGDLHLFTDGSCSNPEWQDGALATFACVSSGSDSVVFHGTCGNALQTSDLAELKAIRYALQWAVTTNGQITIWTDSAFAATGVNRLLCDDSDVPDGAYQDEWSLIQQLLAERGDDVRIHHVAAHQAARNDFQTVAEWASYWNDRVDHEARIAFKLWDADTHRLQRNYTQHAVMAQARLQRLQDLHLQIHERRTHLLTQTPLVEPDMVEPQEDEDDYDILGARLCHAEWQDEFATFLWSSDIGCNLTTRFGHSFSRKMVTWLVDPRRADDMVTVYFSFVEIAAHWVLRHADDLPCPDPTRKNHWISTRSSRLVGEVLTIASVVRLMSHFFAALVPLAPQRVKDLNLCEVGITMPLLGVAISVSRQVTLDTITSLQAFTARRPIRSTNDLARPL